MKSSSPNQQQKSLFTTDLIDSLNPSNRLYKLAQTLPWSAIEKDFESYYPTTGQTNTINGRIADVEAARKSQ